MSIVILQNKIDAEALIKLAAPYYDNLIKGVVDIDEQIIALGGEMHVDAEKVLLENGSNQSALWGFNILLNTPPNDCLVYDSFINIRPRDNNNSLEVEDQTIRQKMKTIIFDWVRL